jgi:hypothetical protein
MGLGTRLLPKEPLRRGGLSGPRASGHRALLFTFLAVRLSLFHPERALSCALGSFFSCGSHRVSAAPFPPPRRPRPYSRLSIDLNGKILGKFRVSVKGEAGFHLPMQKRFLPEAMPEKKRKRSRWSLRLGTRLTLPQHPAESFLIFAGWRAIASGAEEQTSPQLHNSAARHRLREFGRKRLDPCLDKCLTTIVVKATMSSCLTSKSSMIRRRRRWPWSPRGVDSSPS